MKTRTAKALFRVGGLAKKAKTGHGVVRISFKKVPIAGAAAMGRLEAAAREKNANASYPTLIEA